MDDIVYIVKDGASPDELRYSLRSVCANFSFRKVWVYGGCPDGIVPDRYVPFQQTGVTKWERSTSTLRAVFGNDEITPTFYLFNDDFFILRTYDQDVPIVNGSIWRHALGILRRRGISKYNMRLMETAEWLEENGYGTVNFATHTPLKVHRAAALDVLDEVPASILFRNVYGNICGLVYNDLGDFKISDDAGLPCVLDPLVSTTDASFRDGAVGRYVRDLFPVPCRYEEEARR